MCVAVVQRCVRVKEGGLDEDKDKGRNEARRDASGQ